MQDNKQEVTEIAYKNGGKSTKSVTLASRSVFMLITWYSIELQTSI